MPISRYRNDGTVLGGQIKGSARAIVRIRKAVRNGNIRFRVITLTENTRLDQLAGNFYGDGRLWWILAAVTGIGWAWQLPAGTQIRVPTDLGEIVNLI